jgi:hypothetical protein
MPYGKEIGTIISLLEKIVKRLDILTGICITVTIIGVTVIIVKFAINLVTKK